MRRIAAHRLALASAAGLTLLVIAITTAGVARLTGAEARDIVTQGLPCGPTFPPPAAAQLDLDPAAGPAGSMFDANLTGLQLHPNDVWPVYVMWDWSGQPGADIIAQGTSPQNSTSASVPVTVPVGAAPGDHRVTVCWQQFGDNYYTLTESFTVTAPTPTTEPTPTTTPTATPTSTPTPSPTPSPTASPTPAPTPFDFPLQAFPIKKLPLNILYPILPAYDLSIHNIEITQAIQCLDTTQGLAGCPDNSLPMVNRKNTSARIYLRYNGPFGGFNGVPVRLHIFANGQEYIANTFGKATPTMNRGNSDSANVWFRVDFNSTVNVSFYAEIDPNGSFAETNESNNRFPSSGTINVNFRTRDTFDLVGLRLKYKPDSNPAQYAGGAAVNGLGADWLEYIWPVRSGSGIDNSVHSGYLNWTNEITSTDGQHDLIKWLNWYWVKQNYLSWLFGTGQTTGAEFLYGWTPPVIGGHADMPNKPHAGGLGVVAIGTDSPGTDVDNPGSGEVILGHELTHDLTLLHTNTADGCGSGDSGADWPYASSNIQEFGFNPDTGKIYNPSNTHDVMSYCPPGSQQGWVAPFTWNKLYGIVARSVAVTGSENGEGIAIDLVVDNPDIGGDQGGSLGALMRAPGDVEYVSPPLGDGYAVQLRDGANVLFERPFAVDFTSEYTPIKGLGPDIGDPDPAEQAAISFVMPWVDGTTEIALVRNGTDLDVVQVSGASPTATITDPAAPEAWSAGATETVSWSGSDADGDPLTYSVLYNNGIGTGWQLIESDTTATSIEVEVDSLAGGDDAKFRVVATDGVNIGFDESTAVDVPNKAPIPYISGPADGTVALPDQLVVFNGGATDLEDGSIDDTGLTWTSSRDGVLGEGASLPHNSLTPGLHTITLTARDSNGLEAHATVSVLIGVVAEVDVQPDTIPQSGDPGDITVIVELAVGYPTDDIDLDSLRLHIGSGVFEATGAEVLGDTDMDGLIDLELTFDGEAIQKALPDPPDPTTATITGQMEGGLAVEGSDVVGLVLPGDADCDGDVDSVDALQALRHTAGLPISADCLQAANVDCDQNIDSVDALAILRALAGLPNNTPKGCPGVATAVFTNVRYARN